MGQAGAKEGPSFFPRPGEFVEKLDRAVQSYVINPAVRTYPRLFFLTSAVKKTKTQAQNSSQKLKKKTLGGIFQKSK